MFDDVLVHIGDGGSSAQCLDFILHLTEPWRARINGVHVTPALDVGPIVRVMDVGGAVAALEHRLKGLADEAEKAFRAALGEANRAHTWTTLEGDLVAALCREARYADLVVVAQDDAQGPPGKYPLPIAHSIALRAGRPVLITPPRIEPRPLERALIAWDGSREAVRAVHDALPLLQRAAYVEVAVFNPEDEHRELGEHDIARLLDHLQQHDVRIPSVQVLHRARSHGKSILERLSKGDFDLLIAGAYSKPMWLEFIMDGTTQFLLLASRMPIFVSH